MTVRVRVAEAARAGESNCGAAAGLAQALCCVLDGLVDVLRTHVEFLGDLLLRLLCHDAGWRHGRASPPRGEAVPEYGPLVTGTAADASGVRRFRLVMYQPPGFNCKPVISGFAYVQRAELPVYARGGGAGLHPLGAAD